MLRCFYVVVLLPWCLSRWLLTCSVPRSALPCWVGPAPPPPAVAQRLARDGLPVKGISPTWEANRPTALPLPAAAAAPPAAAPTTTPVPAPVVANKLRGFVQYDRKPLPYR